jgi:hypothetical protein
MPCQLCKSPAHTLKYCNSVEGIVMFEAVDVIMKANKFRIIEQIECLRDMSLPELKFIANRINTLMTGRKAELIYLIMWKYFDSVAGNEYHYQIMTDDDLEQINESYTRVYEYTMLQPHQMPYQPVIIEKALNMLSLFYRRRYGPERMGVSLAMYLDSLNYRANRNPMSLSHYERRQRLGREEAVAVEREEFVGLQRERYARRVEDYNRIEIAIQMLQSNLLAEHQKLTFHVEVDETLVQSKECCICYEDMMPVKLGCSHETCLDCLCGIANAKKKSNPVITCAMCRADIDIVYVTSEEIKTELKQKIDVV